MGRKSRGGGWSDQSLSKKLKVTLQPFSTGATITFLSFSLKLLWHLASSFSFVQKRRHMHLCIGWGKVGNHYAKGNIRGVHFTLQGKLPFWMENCFGKKAQENFPLPKPGRMALKYYNYCTNHHFVTGYLHQVVTGSSQGPRKLPETQSLSYPVIMQW